MAARQSPCSAATKLAEPPVIASLLLIAAIDVFGGLEKPLTERMEREEARQERERAEARSPN